MQSDDTPSGWRVQLTEGMLRFTLGVGCGLIDACRGYTYGITTSPTMAAIYVMGAIGVMALHGREWFTRAMLTICLASTVLAGIMEARTELSGHLHATVTQNGDYDTAKRDENAARAALDANKQTGSVEGLEAQQKLKEGEKKAACRGKIVTEDCKAATDELANAITRVDEAKARERAQKALESAQARLKEIGTPTQISAVGASADTEDLIAWIKTGLALAVTQALAMNTGSAWAKMTGAWARRRKKNKEKEVISNTEERQALAERRTKDIKRELAMQAISSKEQEEITFDKMLLWVNDEPDDTKKGVADSKRALANWFGIHENTMKRYLNSWEERDPKLVTVHDLGKYKIQVEIHEVWTPIANPAKAKPAKSRVRGAG